MKIPGPPKTQAGTLLTNASIVAPSWSIPPKADPGPTWRKWLNMPEVELWQAVALSCNIEPPAYYPEGLYNDFDERMDIALAHLVPIGLLNHIVVNSRRHISKVALADVARLAKSCRWPVPAKFPKAKASPIPAPVVAVGAPGGVEPDKAGPLPVEQGLSTKDIAQAFDGVNGWDFKRWRKNLSASKWLHSARIAIGGAGGASSVWNPLMLAQLMHDDAKGKREKEKLMKVFNSRFTLNPALGPWRNDFNEYFATHCATD